MNELSDSVTTPQLADALDLVGVCSQVMAGTIVPLVAGTRAVGRAATVQFAPVDHDVEEPYDEAISFIDGLAPGSLVVISSAGTARTAFWGELFSAAAIGRGAVGAVCDGYIRDSAKIRAMRFAAFSAGTRPIDFRARMEITGRDRPISCGGVLVHPGELILADDDGVVVVPGAVEERAVALANEKAGRETVVLEELRSGASLRSVWDRFRVL